MTEIDVAALLLRLTLGIADDLNGGLGLALSAGLGLAGAAALLATCWRPVRAAEPS